MPFDDPAETDPMGLHGVMFELDDSKSQRDMAACFIEEYIRLGFGRPRLIEMFQKPSYAGPNLAWKQLGEKEIVGLIDVLLARWGPRVPAETPPGRDAAGQVHLPVLT